MDGRRTFFGVTAAVSGAEDLLSRSIVMRLPGESLVTRWGPFLMQRGTRQYHDGNPVFFLHSETSLEVFSSLSNWMPSWWRWSEAHMMMTNIESSTESRKSCRCG